MKRTFDWYYSACVNHLQHRRCRIHTQAKQTSTSIYKLALFRWILLRSDFFHCFPNLNTLSCLYNHTKYKKSHISGLDLCMYFSSNTRNRPTSKSMLCLWTHSAPLAKFVPFMLWVFDNPLKQYSSAFLSGGKKNKIKNYDRLSFFTMKFQLFPTKKKVTLVILNIKDTICLGCHSNPFSHWRASHWKHIIMITYYVYDLWLLVPVGPCFISIVTTEFKSESPQKQHAMSLY